VLLNYHQIEAANAVLLNDYQIEDTEPVNAVLLNDYQIEDTEPVNASRL